MTEWDLAGILRRIRRQADMSQREIALACGVATSVVSKAEARSRDLPVQLLTRLAAVAGLRLAVLDAVTGAEVQPMRQDAVRDAADRQFPAHLDTRHGDDGWWGGPHRPRLRPPRYTFDRDRGMRDDRRREVELPDDHHVPRIGDSLAERAAARRDQAARRAAERRAEAHRAWVAAGCPVRPDDPPACSCPAGCEYAEGSNEDLAHAEECACRCDVG